MIFFDLDDTLLDHETADANAVSDFYNKYKENFPVTKCLFREKWDQLSAQYFQLFLDGKYSFQQQRRMRMRALFARALTDHEADVLFSDYLEFYEQHWKCFPDVLPCLNALFRKGQKLGIISNGSSTQQMKKLKKTGLIDYFSFLIFSGDIGVAKPEPQIFRHACSAAGYSPSQCFYIGDNYQKDIIGSSNVGMKAIWLLRKNPATDHSERTTNIKKIVSLNELPDFLGISE
ncbi:HAD family hydrolase [Sporolactobacillus shoreicorticis]|uniref:HAD family hydrolase n=1 Tax=Sporolactobacillus shoreicorticis TaxID=1923877 RepID=A0ABW5S1N6_9BACL|nr:HAD family hydrolase [Sporolactobacillus shoreicorticis]MCO7126431.1 HAD family hydrolase [Sporolactobacillus shoreicorticis]